MCPILSLVKTPVFGVGTGGFRILIKDSLASVCFWKFKKVGNSTVNSNKLAKFWGGFNDSGLTNIALQENLLFPVLIK